VRLVRRVDDAIARFEGFVLVTLVLGIVLTAALQTFLRNAFDSGIEWADEALRWATLWIAFLGASLATHRGKHIAIDVASRLLPRRVRRPIAFSTSLSAATVAAALAWGAWRFVREIGSLEPPVFAEKVPRGPLEMIVPATFAIMALRFFVQAFAGTREAANASETAPAPSKGEGGAE